MQIQIDRKKWLKSATVLLAELVLILTGLVLVGTVGERGFDNWKVYFTFRQEKQNLEEIKSSANDLIPDGDGYITGEDSFFIIPVNADKLLDVEMNQLNQEITGFIWQSETEEFNSEPATYTYQLGHNPIQVEKGTKYIKLLVSDVSGLHYNINQISYRNPFEVYVRIHKKAIFKIAIVLLLVGVLVKGVEYISEDRTKLKKLLPLQYFFLWLASPYYIFS